MTEKCQLLPRKMELDKVNQVGKEMCEIGHNILETLAKIPEDRTPDTMTASFLKVFAEVLGEVGSLFAAGEVKETLLQQLGSISTYTNLFPYVLLMKQILDRMHEMIKIGTKGHKIRLDSINQRLTQIAVETAIIAQSLEDLGKLLSEIIRSGDTEFKKRSLEAFDYQVINISVSIKGCFASLLIAKSQIEEGLDAVAAERNWLRSGEIITYIVIAASAIIAPFACWLTGAVIGIYALIGVGMATATGFSSVYVPLIHSEKRNLDEIEKQYKEQEWSWRDLDNQLNVLQEKLELAISQRKRLG